MTSLLFSTYMLVCFLTFTTLLAISADGKSIVFFLVFTRKQDLIFHANSETICMKCQNHFSGDKKKKIICLLLKILFRVLSVNGKDYCNVPLIQLHIIAYNHYDHISSIIYDCYYIRFISNAA